MLRRGGVVAFPTETVYGLGALAGDPSACARVFEIKQRPRFDPLIVHLSGAGNLGSVVAALDERSLLLATAFWPGPLTLVLPKAPSVPDIVTAGLPTVAVRIPSHPIAHALLVAVGAPIAAPSANPFGYISPTLASHVNERIGREVDLILDGGATTVGVESTIVDVSGTAPALLRPGAIERERIEALIGPLAHEHGSGDRPRAPGQLASHYAPRTPLVILDELARLPEHPGRVGLLAFGPPDPDVRARSAVVEVLSESRDLREAAANLFAALHRLDRAGVDIVFAEAPSPAGLGLAILDRLTRAAARP